MILCRKYAVEIVTKQTADLFHHDRLPPWPNPIIET
jgi:hypothetical protein